jgi:Mg2+ and Co2+ transporter CorA
VTQQDAATSTTIAREAREDGNSVKIIAALTMVFLPGTYLSSVFGMAALENAHWWLYVAITLPLTILVVVVWGMWFRWTKPGTIGFGLTRKRKVTCSNP